MSLESPHNGEIPSSVAGISDTGNLKTGVHGSANFVETVRRQGYLKSAVDYNVFAILASQMGPQKLYVPFANAQINDLREGHLGPRGLYSAVVLNTFLDAIEFLRWRENPLFSALNPDPEVYAHLLHQAADLMKQISMPQNEIEAFLSRHTLDQAA